HGIDRWEQRGGSRITTSNGFRDDRAYRPRREGRLRLERQEPSRPWHFHAIGEASRGTRRRRHLSVRSRGNSAIKASSRGRRELDEWGAARSGAVRPERLATFALKRLCECSLCPIAS